MHITIGILAYNESKVIARTIGSLFAQSVFNGRDAQAQWDVVVVPNGCKDDTQARAEQALQAACAGRGDVSWRVVSLERAGKSHAWNKLVHELAAPHTDVFVMIDADIEFGHVDTLFNCVQRLRSDSHAWAVVDLPLKDFHRKPRNTLLETLSMRASKARLEEATPAISGQFYLVEAARLRRVWMPIDLSVEDGFLGAMIITDCFRQAPDYSRVVRADDASHYFEGLSRVRDIVRHEVRMIVGTVLNNYLCWNVLLFMTTRSGEGAGDWVRRLNAQNPDWYRLMMNNQLATRGPWPIRFKHHWDRLPGWWALPPSRRIARLPATLCLSAFDAFVTCLAARRLASGQAVGYW